MSDSISLRRAIERNYCARWEPSDKIQEEKLYARIRELEATVTKLEGEIFFLMSLDSEITGPVSIKTIAEVVGAKTGFDLRDFRSNRRPYPLCTARQIFMYMAHEHTKLSYPVIGRFIQKDHTTVVWGVRRIKERMPEEEWLRILIGEIESDLRKIAEG